MSNKLLTELAEFVCELVRLESKAIQEKATSSLLGVRKKLEYASSFVRDHGCESDVRFLTVRKALETALQSVLHNLAGVKSCFLKLSEELEWRNNRVGKIRSLERRRGAARRRRARSEAARQRARYC